MNLNELSKRAHQNAVSHGFWDGQKTTREHCLMLIVTEISEMVEADRHDKHADLALFDYAIKDGEFNDAFKLHVKDSVEDECADIAIRLLDMSGAMGIDFTHVKTPDFYRDFGRFSMTENAFALVKGLAKENISIIKRIAFALQFLLDWSNVLGFDLERHIDMKMRYNEHRGIRHGKKY